MPPQVSIIVPVYNREQFIVECIESVSQQSFRDFELIIVDDGSTDDSRGIAESTLKQCGLAGGVISIQNGGPDIARDKGLERARGQYIALLDSDDLWEREYLEYMLTNLRQHVGATFAFSDFYIRDEDASAIYTKSSTLQLIDTVTEHQADAECVLIEEHLFQYLLQEQPIFIGALVFEREVLARTGRMTRYIQRRIGSLEWEFILRLALTGPALYCRKPLVTIRKHHGNISAEYTTQVEGELAVLETVREHYQLTKSDTRLIDHEVSKRSLSVGYQYFSRGLYPQARNALRGSMLHRPNVRAAKYYCLSMLPDSCLRGIRNLLGKS